LEIAMADEPKTPIAPDRGSLKCPEPWGAVDNIEHVVTRAAEVGAGAAIVGGLGGAGLGAIIAGPEVAPVTGTIGAVGSALIGALKGAEDGARDVTGGMHNGYNTTAHNLKVEICNASDEGLRQYGVPAAKSPKPAGP
jgi:hypothetical protein